MLKQGELEVRLELKDDLVLQMVSSSFPHTVAPPPLGRPPAHQLIRKDFSPRIMHVCLLSASGDNAM